VTKSRVVLVSTLVAAVTSLVLYGTWWALRVRARTQQAMHVPVLGELPPFRLVECRGKVVTNEDLRGSIWVVNFLYTGAGEQAFLQGAEMASLQRSFRKAERVCLLTITVDPEHDTPEVLRAFAERLQASADRWWFLTGEWDQVETLVKSGFRVVLERNDGSAPDLPPILHSTRFALLDGNGRVRQPDAGSRRVDDSGAAELHQRVGHLLRELER
jgi:protein SCO1/2